jgi:hypothetical protein
MVEIRNTTSYVESLDLRDQFEDWSTRINSSLKYIVRGLDWTTWGNNKMTVSSEGLKFLQKKL